MRGSYTNRRVQHDTVMRFDELLLALHIDVEIRIFGILVDYGYVTGLIGDVHELAIDLRLFQMRMEHQYQRLHRYSLALRVHSGGFIYEHSRVAALIKPVISSVDSRWAFVRRWCH